MFTSAHFRSFLGRLKLTPGTKVENEGPSSPGCTPGDEKKLAAAHDPKLAATLRQVAGGRIRWTAKLPGRKNPIAGAIRIPDAKSLLKQGFAYYAKKRDAFPFPENQKALVVDFHNDQRMGWLVVDAKGVSSIRFADAGEEGSSVFVADDLDGYLAKGLESDFVDYWHTPGANVGVGESVADVIRAWRALEVEKPASVKVREMEPLPAADLPAFLESITLNPKVKKLVATRAKAAQSLGPLVRLRLRIDTPTSLGFLYDRAAAALADAPGSDAFRTACGPSDPRFDWLWGRDSLGAGFPEGFVGAHHRKEIPDDFGKASLDADVVLAKPLVPGIKSGVEFAAVAPYT